MWKILNQISFLNLASIKGRWLLLSFIHSFFDVPILSKTLWKGLISTVTRQKGESQNGCFKKTKHSNFSQKRTFLPPWYAHVRSEILTCFVFLKHPLWDSPFCVIIDDLNLVLNSSDWQNLIRSVNVFVFL